MNGALWDDHRDLDRQLLLPVSAAVRCETLPDGDRDSALDFSVSGASSTRGVGTPPLGAEIPVCFDRPTVYGAKAPPLPCERRPGLYRPSAPLEPSGRTVGDSDGTEGRARNHVQSSTILRTK